MDVTPLIPQGKRIIKKYGNGSFLVNDDYYKGNIIVSPDSVIPWQINNNTEISFDSLKSLTNQTNKIDILLIGCGNEHIKAPKELIIEFMKLGISAEMMTTGAACRTYNVLLSEERRVAAALIAV